MANCTMYCSRNGNIIALNESINNQKTVFSECGFSTNQLSGTIVSPQYPKDYPNNVLCTWDIIVPLGHHVALYFNRMDVQMSKNCEKDYLKVLSK